MSFDRTKSTADKANTVKAAGQLEKKDFITIDETVPGALKILFVGNSITRHGYKADIGWPYDHGMAASCPEKDYFHLTMARVRALHPDASSCLTQAALWERHFYEDGILEEFAEARAYAADILIYRLGENVDVKDLETHDYTAALREFLRYLTAENPRCKIIFTTNFWIKVPVDNAVYTIAKEYGATVHDLGMLGEDDRNKAIGLFEHSGVAAHPGDIGMQAIADEIWSELKNLL